MEREPRKTNPAARPLGALAVLGAGAGTVALLSPGGLGEPGPVEVTGGASAAAYRSLTESVAKAPDGLGLWLEAATEGTLVALGLLLVWVGWTAFRRGDARGVGGVVLAGLGTVLAYAISEAVKLVVDEERPCRALGAAVESVAECPAAGDWSFPSNHATLAAALAAGLALLRPRLAWLTLPLAGAAALLRVLVGVHYPHDVLAGAVLGGTVAVAALLALLPLAGSAASRLVRGGGNDSGLVGHDRRGGPVVHAQAPQDGTHVRLDGALHHVQPPGDLPVGQPAAEEGQHLPLPAGQGGHPVPGGGAPAGQGARTRRAEMRDDPRSDLR